MQLGAKAEGFSRGGGGFGGGGGNARRMAAPGNRNEKIYGNGGRRSGLVLLLPDSRQVVGQLIVVPAATSFNRPLDPILRIRHCGLAI